jgi:CHAT domain-containing protein/tetratricopeptide (TPR) repeat protein
LPSSDAQGKLTEAEPLFRDALAMRKRLFKGDHPSLAGSLNDLGALLEAQGRLVEAEPYLQHALAVRRRLFGDDHSDVANSLNNLASLFQVQGKLTEAETLFREVLAMYKRLIKGDHSHVADSLNNLASLLQEQGKLTEAEPFSRDALAMRKRLFMGDHPDVANSLSNLGSLLHAQGKLTEAEPFFRDALAMRKRLFMGDHPDLARILNNLASLLQEQGKLTEAEPFFRDALAMRKRLSKGDHSDVANSLNNLGSLLHEQGKLTEAEPFFRDALSMRKRLFMGDSADVAVNLNNLAYLLLAQGRLTEAETLYHDALDMYRRLALIYVETKSEGEALTFLGTRPITRDGFLSIARRAKNDPAAAYTELWIGKAILFRVHERRHQAARALAYDSNVARLLANLADVRLRRSELILAPFVSDDATRQKQAKDIKELSRRVGEIEADLRPLLPSMPRAEKLAQATPANLQNALSPDTAVVEFAAYNFLEFDKDNPGRAGRKWTPSYVAFVVTRDKIVRVELESSAPIEKAVREWREAIVGSKKVSPDLPLKVRELVWDKVRKELPSAIKTVYIAPDMALTAVPWAALPGDRTGTILLEDYALAMIPHAPFLLDRLWPDDDLPKRPGGVLVVGGVGFDAAVPPAPKPVRVDSRDAPLKPGAKPHWRALPGSEAEAIGVVALGMGRKLDARLLSGKNATTAALLEELPKARFAHLATHGFFADNEFRSALQYDPRLFQMRGRERVGPGVLSPMVLSGLVLAGANNPDAPSRSLVTGEALIDRDLSGLQLAVLSACETGLGDVAGGEGVFGLQRAFHVAGAHNVVATLWKVDDTATAALMAVFYRELWEKDQPPIEALRRAQLEIYHNPNKVPDWAKKLRGKFKVVEGDAGSPPPNTDNRANARLWAAFTLSGSGILREKLEHLHKKTTAEEPARETTLALRRWNAVLVKR